VEPLFPGYLLARFSREDSLREVLHSVGVSTLVQFGENIPTLRSDLVANFQAEFTGEADHSHILPVERKLGPGDEVEMAEGAFRGVTGKIVEVIPAKERVMILLEFLGEERTVQVDPFSLILREKAA
jgi:transcription antitermination factor NusG